MDQNNSKVVKIHATVLKSHGHGAAKTEELKIQVEKNTTEVKSTIHDLKSKVEKDATEVRSTVGDLHTKVEQNSTENTCVFFSES